MARPVSDASSSESDIGAFRFREVDARVGCPAAGTDSAERVVNMNMRKINQKPHQAACV